MMSASHSEPADIETRPLLMGSRSSEDLEGQEIQPNNSLLAAGHQLYQGPLHDIKRSPSSYYYLISGNYWVYKVFGN